MISVFPLAETVCLEMPSLFDQICYQGPQPYNVPIENASLPRDISDYSYFGKHPISLCFVDRERRRENYTYRENQAIHYQGVREFCALLRRFTLMGEYQSLCADMTVKEFPRSFVSLMLIPRLDASIHLLQSRSATESTRPFTYLFRVC